MRCHARAVTARVLVSTLALLGVAACSSNRPNFPPEVRVRGFTPSDGVRALVLERWRDPSTDTMEIVARGDAEVLKPVEGVTVRCVNLTCDAGEPGVVRLRTPPADVKFVDLEVTKAGFDPVVVHVPFTPYSPSQLAVLFYPAKAP